MITMLSKKPQPISSFILACSSITHYIFPQIVITLKLFKILPHFLELELLLTIPLYQNYPIKGSTFVHASGIHKHRKKDQTMSLQAVA